MDKKFIQIKWDNRLKIGNVLIDTDHRLIIAMTNALTVILRHPEEQDALRFFIDELYDFAEEHFKREEQMQVQSSFPHYMENKLGHQQLLSELNSIKESINALATDTEPYLDNYKNKANKISQLLRDWFVNHIIKSDMKMKGFPSISRWGG